MSESSDFNPGVWRGHDFRSARRTYDTHVDRSYNDARSHSTDARDLVLPSVETNSQYPLLIWFDVTGSMEDWPKTMFSKAPYLDLETKEYLGNDVEFFFGAVGDAYTDTYPLQSRAFSQGLAIKDRLKELVIEQGGGGQTTESYELAALYSARNIHAPKAVKPILIFIGDEEPYSFVSPDQAKQYAKVNLKKRITTEEIFAELRRKFVVYLVLKPYNNTSNNSMDGQNRRIYNTWARLLGDDHIVTLPDPNRVVDVIFGILANETGRVNYFMDEVEGRQRRDQVDTVYRSLETVMALERGSTDSSRTGKSKLIREDKGRAARKLLGN